MQLPGSVGGADWQGGAFDQETGVLYVQSITAPFVADILKGDPEKTNLAYVPGVRAYPPGPQGLPLLKPPYGRITAIDLNTGELKWTVANGDGPRDHPLLKALNLPPLGNPGRSSPLVTKIAALCRRRRSDHGARGHAPAAGDADVGIAPGAGGKKFRAFDKATGAVLWETELDCGHDGRADDLHVRRQTVRHRADRRRGPRSRVGRAQSAVTRCEQHEG